ncbi:HNH endonuclease [Cohnella ginsengisoli]|uniref:HNH endonuclease n=1 Tax=Cohnella ginsengisoli TaxID=425004 RepID=A0A9X4KH36_9BACL|nr:HNH endonuclease signature motif containing protein [Cohnella ginsengisoli]MDG0789962.1 HNH endonuclease [Cohnella ginsengisoli]
MFISSTEDLIDNIFTLHNYRDTEYHEFYNGMIKNGVVYIALKHNGEFYFAPSRFAGYKNNNADSHINSYEKDGGETNREISKLMGKERIDQVLEEEYKKYCERNGIVPSNKSRRYWPLIEGPYLREKSMVKDISEIIRNILSFDNGLFSALADVYSRLLYASSTLVVLKYDKDYFFAPSTYVAYMNLDKIDSLWTDTIQHKETDKVISKILEQEFITNHLLDAKYKQYLAVSKLRANNKNLSYCYLDVEEDLGITDITINSVEQTERESKIKARVGQIKYRSALIAMWQKCSVTGFQNVELLRASHIKPWRDCDNVERLDPNNGLLLIPNLDLLFDRGYISFDGDGRILISSLLSIDSRRKMGLHSNMNVILNERQKKYMMYHVEEIFRP